MANHYGTVYSFMFSESFNLELANVLNSSRLIINNVIYEDPTQFSNRDDTNYFFIGWLIFRGYEFKSVCVFCMYLLEGYSIID